MLILADTPSVGLWLGGPFTLLAIVACLVAIVTGVFIFRRESEWGFLLGSSVALVAVCLIALVAYWPLDREYHYWVPKQGTVTNTGNRLISQGEGKVAQRYVLEFGDGKQYGVDDTRAALVKKGDAVRLRCKREHEWGAAREANGYACKWDGRR